MTDTSLLNAAIAKIERLLHLSDAERDHIFFAQNSD